MTKSSMGKNFPVPSPNACVKNAFASHPRFGGLAMRVAYRFELKRTPISKASHPRYLNLSKVAAWASSVLSVLQETERGRQAAPCNGNLKTEGPETCRKPVPEKGLIRIGLVYTFLEECQAKGDAKKCSNA